MSQPKICRVCGDNATGFNFNVITCESCKAFFRRNAVRTKQPKCPYQNECSITVTTRTFCKKCRLVKCLAVGMINEWMVPKKEKPTKKDKLKGKITNNNIDTSGNVPESMTNRVKLSFETMQSTCTNPIQLTQTGNSKPKARVSAMPQQPILSTGIEPSQMPPSFKFSQTFESTPTVYDGRINTDLNWQNPSSIQALQPFNSFNVNNSYQLRNDFSEKISLYMQANNPTSINSDVEMKSYDETFEESDTKNKIVIMTSPSSTMKEVSGISLSEANRYMVTGEKYFSAIVLTITDAHKIDELLRANPAPKYLQQTTTEYDELFKKKPNQFLMDIIALFDLSTRTLIQFSKKITAFRNLCQEDQIALLKGSCGDIANLNTALTYDSEKKGWEFPGVAFFKMDQLKEIKRNTYEEFKRVIEALDPTLKNDEAIRVLLGVIILFTPTRPNILHKKVIEKEQFSYYLILQKYLESKFSLCDARVRFIQLIQNIQQLQKLTDDHVKTYLNCDPNYVGPLLTEIFDL